MPETNAEVVKKNRGRIKRDRKLLCIEAGSSSVGLRVIGLEALEHLADACTRLETADKKMMYCAECGSDEVETIIDKATFDGKIYVYVPVRKCKKCPFQWTDDIGAEVWAQNKAEIDRQQMCIRELLKALRAALKEIGRVKGKAMPVCHKLIAKAEEILPDDA